MSAVGRRILPLHPAQASFPAVSNKGPPPPARWNDRSILLNHDLIIWDNNSLIVGVGKLDKLGKSPIHRWCGNFWHVKLIRLHWVTLTALERQTVARRDGCSGPVFSSHPVGNYDGQHSWLMTISWLEYIGHPIAERNFTDFAAYLPTMRMFPYSDTLSTSSWLPKTIRDSVENISNFGNTSRSATRVCRRHQGKVRTEYRDCCSRSRCQLHCLQAHILALGFTWISGSQFPRVPRLKPTQGTCWLEYVLFPHHTKSYEYKYDEKCHHWSSSLSNTATTMDIWANYHKLI